MYIENCIKYDNNAKYGWSLDQMAWYHPCHNMMIQLPSCFFFRFTTHY